jgi:hypothetical protein
MERTKFEMVATGPESTALAPAVILVERPGRRGARPIGAFVVTTDRVRFVPSVDVERLAIAGAAAAVTATAVVAFARAVRGRPAVGPVHMGPGGWISVKGVRGAVPRLDAEPGPGRPWWAHLLRAHRLVVRS